MKRLRESIGSLGAANPNRVDRERGVIRGVKIVGMQSRNKRESSKGRRYTRECLTAARRLYEGLKVRANHPTPLDQRTGADRKTEDVLGELFNVRLGHDGLYGDLRYLKSHPLAERLCEAAERMPGAFGLSHDVAKWQGDYDGDGVYVITAIERVDGVDLVDSPGTTSGLFESEGKRMKTKKPKAKPRIKLDDLVERLEKKGALRESLEKLRESGDMDGAMMLGEGADAESSVNNAFMTACQSVLADGKADRKAKLAKLGSIMEAQEKLIASGALTKTDTAAEEPDPDGVTESEDEEEGGEPDPDEEAAKRAQESLKQENARLKLRESCQTLARGMGVTLTETQLKAMTALENDAERKAFLRESTRPGPAGSGRETSVAGGEKIGVDDFLKRVTRRR